MGVSPQACAGTGRRRNLSKSAGNYLKRHSEALVKDVGIEAAARLSGKSKATLGRYYSDDAEHADRFMPIDVVAALEPTNPKGQPGAPSRRIGKDRSDPPRSRPRRSRASVRPVANCCLRLHDTRPRPWASLTVRGKSAQMAPARKRAPRGPWRAAHFSTAAPGSAFTSPRSISDKAFDKGRKGFGDPVGGRAADHAFMILVQIEKTCTGKDTAPP